MAKWKPDSDVESDLESEGGVPVFWYLLNRHYFDP